MPISESACGLRNSMHHPGNATPKHCHDPIERQQNLSVGGNLDPLPSPVMTDGRADLAATDILCCSGRMYLAIPRGLS